MFVYILFTNDLPDVIHTEHEPLSHKDPHLQCGPCGGDSFPNETLNAVLNLLKYKGKNGGKGKNKGKGVDGC